MQPKISGRLRGSSSAKVIWKANVPWGSFPVFQAFRNRARHSWSDHELPTHRIIGTWRHWLRFSTLRPPLETCGTWPANERPQFGRVATAALHRLEHRHVDQPGGLAVVKPPLNCTRCIESQRIGDKYWSIIKFHKFLLIEIGYPIPSTGESSFSMATNCRKICDRSPFSRSKPCVMDFPRAAHHMFSQLDLAHSRCSFDHLRGEKSRCRNCNMMILMICLLVAQ